MVGKKKGVRVPSRKARTVTATRAKATSSSRPRANGSGAPTNRTLGVTASKYLAALLHPFSKQAEGATVPEPYAVNTTTRKAHVPFVLTSNSGGGVDFAITPNVLNSFVQFTGTSSGGVDFPIPNVPAGVTFKGVVSLAQLAAIYMNYRIVAMGVRIKTNVDFTKSGGRLYGAIMPAGVTMPGSFDTGTVLVEAARMCDIPFDGSSNSITTSIINLPRGFQFSISELMSEGGAEITFPIAGAASTTFLEGFAQNREQRTANLNLGTALMSTLGDGSLSTAGFTQLVVRGEGLQPSTDVLTVEVIFHVEGTDSVSTSIAASSSLIAAMPMRPPPSGPHEIHACHAHLSVVPVVRYVSEKLEEEARAFGGRAVQAAKSRAVNSAERVLGIAARSMSQMFIA